MKAPSSNPFKAARRAGVPLVAIETADPAQAIRNCLAAMNGKGDGLPVLVWDCISGLFGRNEPGKDATREVCGDVQPDTLVNPSELLAVLSKGADKLIGEGKRAGVVFCHNFHRYISGDPIQTAPMVQGVWNCRDAFKGVGATLVLLGPSFSIPAELKNDLVLISEALPGADELSKIVDGVCRDAQLDPASIPDRPRVIDTLTGVSAFGAEQILAMSITKDGIDQGVLTERQRLMIEQTPGLSVWRGNERLSDVGGQGQLVQRLSRILKSKTVPVNGIMFCDELEKQWAGSLEGASDGGTSKDQLGQMLQFLNDNRVPMLLLVGPGGTGKSLCAKAAASISGIPVVSMDFGGMKAGIVGESEGRIRNALKIALAVTNGKLILIATCNRIQTLPAEVRRRITLGVYMVDLPTAEERKVIWGIHMQSLGLQSQDLPNDRDWTGAEIRACCESAYREEITLIEAAASIVPIARSAPDQVESIRKLAHGKFLSGSYPGFYRMPTDDNQPAVGRKMERD